MHADAKPLPARLSGAVWGHLVGDALGVPYEFRSASAVGEVAWRGHGAHDQPAGTWSDDGALMLALLDSLLSVRFHPDDQAKRSLAWRDHGSYAPGGTVFDIGGATRTALSAIKRGTRAIDAGPADERSCGNGSLMRILPLALVERSVDDARLVERAHLASRVTHGHPRCQVACALYSLIVRRLLAADGDRATILAGARARLRETYAQPGLEAHRTALDELDAWIGRSGRGFVLDSFWSAWDAFAGADSYREAVTRAIRYGADTDTTAAIAGGLAGAWWGIEGIPVEWLSGLRDPQIVRPLVDRLIETSGPWRTSTASPLRVDRLDLGGIASLEGAAGSVGITFLLGKQGDGLRADHWRDLHADLDRLRSFGIDTLLLLVEDSELVECRVTGLPAALAVQGIDLMRFPIRDPRTPRDPVAFRATIAALLDAVRDGRHVVIACRGGVDRSGMTAACLLCEAGLDAEAAIDRVHRARKRTLTLGEQQAFVRAWPRD